MEKPPNIQSAMPLDYDSAMLLVFIVPDSNQLPIAHQAVEEFFHKCGFESERDAHEAVGQEGNWAIRFYTPVVARRR